MATREPRKVVLEGKGPLTLRPSDYVTQGGEGSIYRSGSLVIKIYTDPEKMRREGMVDKLKLLARFTHEYIVAPQGVVTKQDGEPIGFYMPYAEGEPLARVFTNDFRQREGFNNEMTKKLVARMHDAMEFAHQGGAVMVDANELNWLAYLKGAHAPSPRVIDVDSWAIGRFGASVIMPSIKDWHSKGFTPATDWFAWGIVSFQVWSGIHPYKGMLDGFKLGDLEARMKANKSVFTKGVRLNRAVRDWGIIPGPLLSWYQATFDGGERTKPPSPLVTGVVTPRAALILRTTTTATGHLVFEKLFGDIGNPALRIFPSGIALLHDGSLVDLRTRRVSGKFFSRNGLPAQAGELVKVDGGWLMGSVIDNTPKLEYVSEATGIAQVLTLPIAAQSLFRSENRLFAVTENGLIELALSLFGKPVLAVGKTWGVLPNSTKWFDGVGVEDALGAMFLVLPFGEKACTMVRVRELDGLIPVAGVAGPRFVAVVTIDRNGKYERFEFTFDREYQSYTHMHTEVDTPELNMTVLPKGVVTSIDGDGELTILVPISGKMVKVTDKHIGTDMTLGHWDDRVLYIEQGAVWSVRMS